MQCMYARCHGAGRTEEKAGIGEKGEAGLNEEQVWPVSSIPPGTQGKKACGA